ncbi:MAG: helix-turn-helix transcriptional regulator [Actinomycetota bacterium]
MVPDDTQHRVVCHLDKLLAENDMTLVELSRLAGITVANLSVLKNDRAKAIRFSTLTTVCDALNAQPGDLFSVDTQNPETAPTPAP